MVLIGKYNEGSYWLSFHFNIEQIRIENLKSHFL